jgi:hypothetical protein
MRKKRIDQQRLRRRIASVLHLVKEEVTACALTLKDDLAPTEGGNAQRESEDKANGLFHIAELIAILEPTFLSDDRYDVEANPLSASTVKWMNSKARSTKVKKGK